MENSYQSDDDKITSDNVPHQFWPNEDKDAPHQGLENRYTHTGATAGKSHTILPIAVSHTLENSGDKMCLHFTPCHKAPNNIFFDQSVT